ncbi:hypothetical protein B296_00032436 [Ensete ventricosum]|uniref:Uncharacterized protein n=1 Tax=Ensete ventricosum TaxID=4639 RepID=A0A426YFD6_ENSVE|nr:hypothetical protein B296_00032436 [Ensete ventricosum]
MVRGCCGFRFVTEVAPPKLIAVVKNKAPQMLDTIEEEEEKLDSQETLGSATGKQSKQLVTELEEKKMCYHGNMLMQLQVLSGRLFVFTGFSSPFV